MIHRSEVAISYSGEGEARRFFGWYADDMDTEFWAMSVHPFSTPERRDEFLLHVKAMLAPGAEADVAEELAALTAFMEWGEHADHRNTAYRLLEDQWGSEFVGCLEELTEDFRGDRC